MGHGEATDHENKDDVANIVGDVDDKDQSLPQTPGAHTSSRSSPSKKKMRTPKTSRASTSDREAPRCHTSRMITHLQRWMTKCWTLWILLTGGYWQQQLRASTLQRYSLRREWRRLRGDLGWRLDRRSTCRTGGAHPLGPQEEGLGEDP